jgi:hypothetical protein
MISVKSAPLGQEERGRLYSTIVSRDGVMICVFQLQMTLNLIQPNRAVRSRLNVVEKGDDGVVGYTEAEVIGDVDLWCIISLPGGLTSRVHVVREDHRTRIISDTGEPLVGIEKIAVDARWDDKDIRYIVGDITWWDPHPRDYLGMREFWDAYQMSIKLREQDCRTLGLREGTLTDG